MAPNTINTTSITIQGNEEGGDSIIATHTKIASEVDINGIKCNLTDEFGLFIQGLLALVAFSTLLLKRYREPVTERRTFKIWFFDTSKQGVGAIVIHFANVLLAGLFSGDPCTWYFINFLLDSTVGLVIIYVLLTLTQVVVKKYELESLRFGVYGTPPRFHVWVGQCFLYIIVVIIEKIIIALLVQLDFWEKVRKFILKPINSPETEVVIVMLIVPFLFNAFMFWVVDNFLMRKKRKSYQTSDTKKVKVKYQRKSEQPKSPGQSDEEAVLLDNIAQDEEEAVHQREVVR